MENNNKKFEEKLKIMEKKYLQKMEGLENKFRQFESDKGVSKIPGNLAQNGNERLVDKDLEDRMRKEVKRIRFLKLILKR